MDNVTDEQTKLIEAEIERQLLAQRPSSTISSELAGIGGLLAGSGLGLGLVGPAETFKERRILKQQVAQTNLFENEREAYQALRSIIKGEKDFQDFGRASDLLKQLYDDPKIKQTIQDDAEYAKLMKSYQFGRVADLGKSDLPHAKKHLRTVRNNQLKQYLPYRGAMTNFSEQVRHPLVSVGALGGALGGHALYEYLQKNASQNNYGEGVSNLTTQRLFGELVKTAKELNEVETQQSPNLTPHLKNLAQYLIGTGVGAGFGGLLSQKGKRVDGAQMGALGASTGISAEVLMDSYRQNRNNQKQHTNEELEKQMLLEQAGLDLNKQANELFGELVKTANELIEEVAVEDAPRQKTIFGTGIGAGGLAGAGIGSLIGGKGKRLNNAIIGGAGGATGATFANVLNAYRSLEGRPVGFVGEEGPSLNREDYDDEEFYEHVMREQAALNLNKQANELFGELVKTASKIAPVKNFFNNVSGKNLKDAKSLQVGMNNTPGARLTPDQSMVDNMVGTARKNTTKARKQLGAGVAAGSLGAAGIGATANKLKDEEKTASNYMSGLYKEAAQVILESPFPAAKEQIDPMSKIAFPQ